MPRRLPCLNGELVIHDEEEKVQSLRGRRTAEMIMTGWSGVGFILSRFPIDFFVSESLLVITSPTLLFFAPSKPSTILGCIV